MFAMREKLISKLVHSLLSMTKTVLIPSPPENAFHHPDGERHFLFRLLVKINIICLNVLWRMTLPVLIHFITSCKCHQLLHKMNHNWSTMAILVYQMLQSF